MFDIINSLESNKEWLFSGLGITILGCLVCITRTIFHWLHKQNNTEPKQIQVTGDNSVNLQAGGNLTVNNSHFGGKENVK